MAEDKKLLFKITGLKQWFPVGKKKFGKEQKYVRANDGISLDIYEGETFGLVGESGCGKSTFGRTLLQLYPQTAGRSIYYGRTMEEVAPKYVEDIFKNLKAHHDNCEKLQEKAKELRSQYEAMEEGEEKNILLNKVNEAVRDADNELKDITALIGGLYTAANLDEVSQVYLKKYRAGVEKRDAEVRECEDKIKALKDANRSNPDFELYESYVDDGINLARLTEEEMRHLRQDLQLIFQDPYSSLNPRMTVGQIIGEGLKAHEMFEKNDENMQEYVLKVMEDCGLAPYF
ncbi:MAG: ATP-binding cassette domain-containing protein, partial [Acetivibrio ethanolgignens]